MKLFRIYLKQRAKGITVVLIFFLLFAASFFLYHLPFEAVIYPMVLCILVGVMHLLIDFGRVRKKHLSLTEIQKLSARMISGFPVSESIAEKDYQDIIQSLQEELEALELTSDTKYHNLIEYYTVWVHQIKTPIASMKLNLQNEDTLFARKLSSDLFRIEQYVEMVLAYLRLDSISSDYVFKEYCVDNIVKQAVKKFASEFITRKIRLEYTPISENVVTDEKWISFVLEQLISNALKYTGEGGRIRIYMKEPKTLCIEDTGIGIAPEDLPRIFEKGYTGYNGHTNKSASGIGLYLCEQICNNLGAEITAISEVDKGTAMCIHLEQYHLITE